MDESAEHEMAQIIDSYVMAPMIIHDNPSKRQVAHFGLSYSAARRSIAGWAPAIPDVLRQLIDTAAHALRAGEVNFEQVLVTDYPPGAGIGRHRDAPPFGVVLGISLLTACHLQFERRTEGGRQVWEQLLPPRSAYLLTGQARWDWKHGISAVARRRLSVTARELRSTDTRASSYPVSP